MYPSFSLVGDRAIRMTFAREMSEQINADIRRTFHELKNKEQYPYIEEMIPGYTTLTVFYDPLIVQGINQMKTELMKAQKTHKEEFLTYRKITLPVLYGGDKGPDLSSVADYHNLNEEEVIHRHTSREYLVYMMGFAPGFPYLGGMDEGIATPRLKNPRRKVEHGSVGIAGKQTGVYSLTSPGGWQIIGRTPVSLFNKDEEVPSLLRSGDRLTFQSISQAEFDKIIHQDKKGIFEPRIEWKNDEGRKDDQDGEKKN
ncbi:5-oxoprolinase subunit PxpB [Salipaludibacillus sp. CF4.18]|uniref:5-oxoprolinase subunit PxpB n=1 Tax=Salipaludibacillus sp. CF4.18 TaxID=3373081 RepID=UPI003EE6B8AE